MIEFLYIWLGIGFLHFIFYTYKTGNRLRGYFSLLFLCFLIGPPFFFYELYRSIKRRF